MTGKEDNVGFLVTGSGVKQFRLSSGGCFVLQCRRFFPELRSTTHTSSLRPSATADSDGSQSWLGEVMLECCFAHTASWRRRVKRWRDAKMVIYRVGDAQVGQWSNPVAIAVGG